MKLFRSSASKEIRPMVDGHKTRGRVFTSLVIASWLLIVFTGLFYLTRYENTAGTAAASPLVWPSESGLQKARNGKTLVMLLHPHCPCSRATIEELAQLMSHSQGRLTAYVLFLKPASFTDDWEKTDLWESAARIPGVSNIVDYNGAEAKRFGAMTSGQTLVFDSGGKLLFSGGITESRGHSGENAGRSAVESIVNTGSSITVSTSVYGCPLFDPKHDCDVSTKAINER